MWCKVALVLDQHNTTNPITLHYSKEPKEMFYQKTNEQSDVPLFTNYSDLACDMVWYDQLSLTLQLKDACKPNLL